MNAYFLLRLLQTGGVGPARVREIIEWMDHTRSDCEDILGHEISLRKILSEKQIQSFISNKQNVDDLWRRLEEAQIRVLSVRDVEYPALLRQRLGRKAPPVLFARGNLELLKSEGVGFCGSRQASNKGLETAFDIADQLARQDLTVVSGYAAGVDLTTHQAALAANGSTIIVLAEGISHLRVKKEMKEFWDWNRVLVLSEFPPGLPWSVANAMQRNITICGISKALIVIEAGETGGTIEAGKSAMDISVPVFVAVYDDTSTSAGGNKWLLRNGGAPIMKSKSTGRANIRDIIGKIATPPALFPL